MAHFQGRLALARISHVFAGELLHLCVPWRLLCSEIGCLLSRFCLLLADAKPSLNRYGATIADLAARAVHCCYGGNWPSRLGGIAALECLVPRLPASTLQRLAPAAAKAAFAVLRILPEGAAEEKKLGSLLQSILRHCGCDVASHVDAATPVGAEAESNAAPAPSGSDSKPENQHLPALLRQLMEILVQQLLSSRSSMAVRAVAADGLQVCARASGH